MKNTYFSDPSFIKSALLGVLKDANFFIYEKKIYHIDIASITPPGRFEIKQYTEEGETIERVGEGYQPISKGDVEFDTLLSKIAENMVTVIPDRVAFKNTRMASIALDSLRFMPIRSNSCKLYEAEGTQRVHWNHNDRLGLTYTLAFTVKCFKTHYRDAHPGKLVDVPLTPYDREAYRDLHRAEALMYARLNGKKAKLRPKSYRTVNHRASRQESRHESRHDAFRILRRKPLHELVPNLPFVDEPASFQNESRRARRSAHQSALRFMDPKKSKLHERVNDNAIASPKP